MKGLFIKDWKLLMQQKTYFLIVAGVSVFCLMTGQDMIFAVSYCAFLVASVAVSTITYDDMGNGLACIFTWPASRRQYVLEKYLFTGIAGFAAWMIMVLAGLIVPGVNIASAAEWLIQSSMVLVILTFAVSTMIPIKLKFGAEKGRIVTFLVVFFIFGCIGVVSALDAETRSQIDAMFAALESLPSWFGTAVAVLLPVAALVVSVLISIRIAEKKEV